MKKSKTPCSIEYCFSASYSRTYCRHHYSEWRKSPLAKELYNDYLNKRKLKFWNNVDKTAECWIWKGGTQNKGYGLLSFNNKKVLAHRLAWYFIYNKWPVLNLLHSCDTPLCVNVDHLHEGSQQENIRDAVKKNRHSKGSTNGHAKLTEENVLIIKSLIGKIPINNIATRFNVAKSTISDIKFSRTWKHL